MTNPIPASRKRAKSTQAATKPLIKGPVAAKRKPAAAPAVIKKAAKAAAPALPVADPLPEHPKAKLVRDSFTIPKPEYETLALLKRRALGLGIAAKKSELIRAGIAALDTMDDSAFETILSSIPNLKTGRPKGAPV